MKPIPFIITVGRSGSSFLALVLERLGLTVDPRRYWNARGRAGMEHSPVVDINTQLCHLILKEKKLVANDAFYDKLAKEWRERMLNALKPLGAVKAPRFCITLPVWLRLNCCSGAIVLMRDSIEALVKSRDAATCGLMGPPETLLAYHAHAVWTLERFRIPYTTHVFPRFIKEAKAITDLSVALWQLTGKEIAECRNAIMELKDPSKVTQ